VTIHYDVCEAICRLRLDAPPLNTISLPLLDELRDAVARANRDAEVGGIVITGTPDHFSAGADIELFRQITCPQDALSISRVFQEVFQAVEDSAKPVAAAVAGRMMGAALELAMACHWRACSEGTTFNMPEVRLGISSGAGGTRRLPRLVGPERALDMLLGAEVIDARDALDLGLVDAVCRRDELLPTAGKLLQDRPAPRRTSELTEKTQDAAAGDAALQKARESLADARSEIIAPWKIIEAVEAGLKEAPAAAMLAEREAFAGCMETPAAKNKIYLFFATRQTSKIPGLARLKPKPIAGAAVVGAGSMGGGIAQALISAGVPVVVYDRDAAAVEKSLQRIRRSLQRRADRGRLSPQQVEESMALISAGSSWRDFAGADLVIEAVFEDLKVKQSVLGKLETVCAAETLIATNTSTISLDLLAGGMQHGERLVGMHFFNPAQRMPLVEIVRHHGARDEAVARAMSFARRIGKTPVLVRNREGFLVNRLFIPYLKEAFWLLEDGATARQIDAAMEEFGFAMGPLATIDMAGLDILVFTDRVMSRAFPAAGSLSAIAAGLVERGCTGQKAGAGVYTYQKGDYTPHHSEMAECIIAEVQQQQGLVPRNVPPDEITRRLVLRMVGEAFCVIEEGIVPRRSDVDVAMVLGTGFPDFRGGVLKYAEDIGLDRVQSELEDLRRRLGPRFAPCKLLREITAKGVS